MFKKSPDPPGTRFNTVLIGVAALTLMAMVGVSYREWRQFSRANADAARTREIVDSVDALLSDLSDAERSQRGFLLTGEDRYLNPYNRTIQVIPNHLAHLESLLAPRPGESANVARLESLVGEKLKELRQAIELRRTQGVQSAVALILSDESMHAMGQIRALSADIKRREGSAQTQASAQGEAAAAIALLATVAGSVVLLFLFAFGFEPFASPDPQAMQRSWAARYGAAVLAVVVMALFRTALTPLMGGRSMPFTLFFPAVWFAAWYGGLRPCALSVALSGLAGSYLFAEPTRSLLIRYHDDQVALLMLVLVGAGMALLSRSQRLAVERATHAENAEREERERFETTLASIGDAVIATDAEGRVTFVNKIARSLLRASEADVAGKHLDDVFRIVNEFTRAKVESPVIKVLREGKVVGLANHTVLIAQDGAEVPIDDSAAPICAESGLILGTVLVFRDITERRRAEAASRLLSSIVESSDDAIISKDLNGIVTSWNKGAERIFGYSAEEMNGQPISRLAAPDLPNEIPEILERLRRGERLDHYRTVRRTKTGKLIHASITVSPVRDATGRIVGASKILRDVTAQVNAEAQVAEQRERLRVTPNSIGDAVIATDAQGRVTFVNQVASSLLKAPAPEVVGRDLNDVFHVVNELTRAKLESPVSKVLREGKVAGLANHTVLIAQDGSEVPIDDSAAPICAEGGLILGVVLVFRDVTGRRANERLLAAQTAELRQRAHLMERAHCFVRDLEDHIVFWNQGAADLYGYSAEQALGQVSHTLLKTVFPAPLEDILAQLRSVGQWDGELLHTRRAGDRVTVASHWALHRDEDGRPVATLEVNLDITDRKRAEEARRESELAARLLRVQDEERRRIGRDLHDSAGQKLVLLKIHLDSLPSYLARGEEGRQKLAECTRLAGELIKEVRTTSYALYPPMLEEVGLKSAIPWYLDGLKERSGIVTQLEIAPDLVRPPREVELALFRVLQESLTNVLRHSESPVADIRLEMKDGWVRLEVADQGKGIPPEVLDAYNRESFGKLGVGLRGMKERIRQLGGKLIVSSTAGGTIVSAAVPCGEPS
jgi:PAS domain S-box-containing protein